MIFYCSLNTTVDKLIENIDTKILDKHELTDNNDIIVDKDFEFFCDIFNKLCLNK